MRYFGHVPVLRPGKTRSRNGCHMGESVASLVKRCSLRAGLALICAALVAVTVSYLLPSAAKPRTDAYVVTAAINESATTIGLADSQLYFLSEADINRQLDEMLGLGVQNVRIQMPWAGIEPAQGVYDWSQVDRVVNAANARNMGVLGVLNATPPWAATPNTPPYAGAPISTSAYANFTSQVAQRYAGKVSAYEVWNEPNIGMFWAPEPDPVAYTNLLKAAYASIKAADPNATVVGGVLTSTLDFGSFAMNPVRYVDEMYAAGAQGYFDALSFHPYQYSTKFSEGLDLQESPLNQLNAIRNLMVANGDAAKLIWATEYGLPTNVVTEQQQADYISDILNAWKNVAYGGPLFVYSTRDLQTGGTNPEDNFGVFRTDWTAKLAAEVIKQAIKANMPPPPVDPVGAALAAFFQQAAQAFVAAINQNLLGAFANSVVNAVSTAIANFFASLGGPRVAASVITAAAETNSFADLTATTAEGSTTPSEPTARLDATTVAGPEKDSKATPDGVEVEGLEATNEMTEAGAKVEADIAAESALGEGISAEVTDLVVTGAEEPVVVGDATEPVAAVDAAVDVPGAAEFTTEEVGKDPENGTTAQPVAPKDVDDAAADTAGKATNEPATGTTTGTAATASEAGVKVKVADTPRSATVVKDDEPGVVRPRQQPPVRPDRSASGVHDGAPKPGSSGTAGTATADGASGAGAEGGTKSDSDGAVGSEKAQAATAGS